MEHHIEEEEEQVFKLSREVISDEEIGKMLTNFAEEKIWYASRIRYRVVIFQMSGVRMPAALPAFLTVFHGAVSCLFSVTFVSSIHSGQLHRKAISSVIPISSRNEIS